MRRPYIPVALVGLLTLLTAGAAVWGIKDRGRVLLPSSGKLRMAVTEMPLLSPQEPPGVSVSSVQLQPNYWFNGLTTADGQLVITGQPVTGLNGPLPDQCLMAPVHTATLGLGHIVGEACSNPAVNDQTVQANVAPIDDGRYLAVSISRRDPAIGQVTMGPPVMLCAYASDTRPVIASGGGSIWVYDVATPFGAVALEVSGTTGAIEDTVVMPKLYRPLMAVDRDGLWIGNSIQGSATHEVIYHVAPGAKTVTGMVPSLAPGERPRNTLTTQWLTASGDNVWAGIGTNLTRETIWRFEGPDARVVFKVPDRGFDPFNVVVGNLIDGLWTQVPSPRPPTAGPYVNPTSNEILEINPVTGAEKVVAKLPPLPEIQVETGPSPGEMVFLNGSLYLLQPPFEADGYLGYRWFYKVTPRRQRTSAGLGVRATM